MFEFATITTIEGNAAEIDPVFRYLRLDLVVTAVIAIGITVGSLFAYQHDSGSTSSVATRAGVVRSASEPAVLTNRSAIGTP
jgi:uncharacterized membrane protein